MIKLLKNARVYAPAPLGKKDLLIMGEKICRVDDRIDGYDGLPDVEVFDLAGTVTEIGEDFILFETADGQLVQANLSADTVFEGKTIEAGDFIHVTYNGQMTFSLPGQISAMRVGCYAFTGVVDEIAEGSFLLKSEMDILVKATAEQLENLQAGQTVTVYSNGIMTASLPGQITAEMIVAAETIAD